MHAHLRFDHCVKKQKISKNTSSNNETFALLIELTEIIKFTVSFKNLEYEVEFRNWNTLKVLIKFNLKNDDTHVCLNTECDVTFCDKKFIVEKMIDFQIQIMTVLFKIRDIDFITHKTSKFVIVFIYFLKKKQTRRLCFRMYNSKDTLNRKF